MDADFLEKGEKISRFKQNRIRKVGALEHWHKNFLTNEMIFLHRIPENSENKTHGLYFSRSFLKGLFLELLIYGGKFPFQNRLGSYWEGNIRLKIRWASL